MDNEAMNLGEWMQYYGIKWESGLCVNLATDGLKPYSDHLLGVGTQFPGQSPEYTYVIGGFPAQTYQYNGITFDHYSHRWLGAKRAQEVLKELVEGAEFLVVGNFDFFRDWLGTMEPPLSALGDYPVFGLMDYAKYLDSGDRLYPGTGDGIDAIMKLIRSNVADMRYHGGYTMNSLYARLTGSPVNTAGVIFESQTTELTRLYCSMLWA